MDKAKKKFHFEVSVAVDRDDGEILAVYFRVRKGNSAECIESEDGAVVADYDKDGNLLGVELLAPCSVQVLDRIARREPPSSRTRVRNFLRNNVPRRMIAA